MASEKRVLVTMACDDCKHRNYTTRKNRNNNRERLELKKFCSNCSSHTVHRETR